MNRVKSVDVLRTIAILAVVAIHTTPFEMPSSPVGLTLDLATLVNQLARFAVPLFFLLSGYYWANKFNDEDGIVEPTLKLARRIVMLYVVWSVIYLLPFDIVGSFSHGLLGPIKQIYWNLSVAVSHPLRTLVQGTQVHLWFLVGLLSSLLISALLLRFRFKFLLLFVAVSLYLAGLAGKAYSHTPLGFYADFNFRDGPFFALIFFVTGYFLQRMRNRGRWFLYGSLLTAGGVMLHFAELMLLNEYWGVRMHQDYVVGTYFYGVGVALVALSNPWFLQSSRIASIGPLVLGIYASHFMFVDLLSPLERRYSGVVIWDVFYLFAVFFLAYLLALALSRHHMTRKLVA